MKVFFIFAHACSRKPKQSIVSNFLFVKFSQSERDYHDQNNFHKPDIGEHERHDENLKSHHIF